MPAERAIGISPGYQKLQLTPGETYEGTISVLNPSTDPDSLVGYFVSVTPFSVSGEKYQTDFISFSDANQIVNWITIDEPSGSVQPGELVEVKYRITVPDNALGGGQYCALVARISDSDFESSGYSISSRSQVASLLYATVSGELNYDGTVLENNVPAFVLSSPISTTSRLRNTGNSYADATYVLRISNPLTEEELYSTAASPKVNTIIPGADLLTTNTWEETPALGLFRVTQSISYLDEVSSVTKLVFVCPLWFLAMWFIFIVSCVAWFTSRRRARLLAKKNAKDYLKPDISRK